MTPRLGRMKARLGVLLVAATLVVPLLIVSASPAAAHDSYPCGPQYFQPWAAKWDTPLPVNPNRVQDCPLWKGSVPVYAFVKGRNPGIVGYLNSASGNWFYCQFQVATTEGTYRYGSYYNTWWAATVSDYPYAFGYVSEVFFKGGNNNEPDATLRSCY
jgi:hypothetical protein